MTLPKPQPRHTAHERLDALDATLSRVCAQLDALTKRVAQLEEITPRLVRKDRSRDSQ